MIDPAIRNINLFRGADFYRKYRLRKDATPTYWVITAATAKIFNDYGLAATEIDAFTVDVTDGASGFVAISLTAAETLTLEETEGATGATISRYGVWYLDCTVTDGAVSRVIRIFRGDVSLGRLPQVAAP